MELTIYTPSTPTDLTQVAIVSATDRTPITDILQMVLGNQEALTLNFVDEEGAVPSWVTDAGVSLTVGVGTPDAIGEQLYAATSFLTVSGNTRVGTLDLNTALLRDAAYRLKESRCGTLPGAWLTLELRKTDASGNRDTIALLPVFILWRVLSASPTIPASDTVSGYITGAEVAATYLAKTDAIHFVPMIFFGSAIDEQVFGYFYAERAAKILGVQMSAQTAPVGATLTIDLVDANGVEQSQIASLAAGSKEQRTIFASPFSVSAATAWRGKIKSVGSSTPGGYITANLIIQPNP